MGVSASWLPSHEALGRQRAVWWDSALLLMLGGIPWQVYFQRVLAAKSARVAVGLSVFSGFVCLLAALPAVAIGVAAVATDWSTMGLSGPPDAAFTLPYVVHHLTSPWIATLGLGAIAAAVMSSADSSILSAASLTAWNLLPQTGEVERQRLLKKVIWIIGITTMLIALQVQSIYALWVLCSDFVYCLLFPALVTALFDKKANHYGAIAGFAIALVLRLGGGEPVFALEPWLPYPEEAGVITVPFKTIAMLANLAAIIMVSRIFRNRS
jgi:high affinity choline transporter 7